jgi:hypothetical protein
MKIYGLPQPISGAEIVTIAQEQNGQLAECSMPLSALQEFLISSWLKSLPVSEPATSGIAWNNAGVISIS